MAQKPVVSVGADIKERGKFYWNIRSVSGEVILAERGFKSLAEAKADLDQFKKNLLNAVIIENQ